MKRIIVLLSFLFISGSLFAGPFGLEMGMSYEKVKEACGGREPVRIEDGKYMIVPQKPHPYFVTYIAWIDDNEGLNYIKAIGSDIQTNGYGFELKNKFSSLETSLSKTYGKCDRTDFLFPGSIWDDLEDWMRALEKQERYLMTQWSSKVKSNLPESIAGIYLVASANNTSSGYITLEYEFSNHEKISEAKKAEEDSVF